MSPFFSVVIPTLNRAELLVESVESVLAQSFSDFELIISDNCSTDRTPAICKQYATDARLVCLRPGGRMSMADHWEFATRHARGAYVAVLTDRHVMRPSALEFLHAALSRQAGREQVMCWYDDSPFFPASGIVKTHGFSGDTNTYEAREVILGFAHCNIPRTVLPHALNSCYSSGIAETIRRECGRLFLPASPDYTSAFLLLAYAGRVTYVDVPLYVTQAVWKLSTGYKAAFFGAAEHAATLGDVDPYSHVPLRIDCTANALLNDLLRVKELLKDRLDFVHLKMENYLLALYEDILRKERSGSPLNLSAVYEKWSGAVRSLPPSQRSEVERRAALLRRDLRRRWAFALKYAGRLGLLPLVHALAGILQRWRHVRAGGKVFGTALEAARATDSILCRSGGAR